MQKSAERSEIAVCVEKMYSLVSESLRGGDLDSPRALPWRIRIGYDTAATKVNSRNHGYQKTLDWIDRSLANFGMDYIDLFLIHDPLSGKDRRLETWRAAIKARDDGKLRSIGVSN